jgi:hypothetical protein
VSRRQRALPTRVYTPDAAQAVPELIPEELINPLSTLLQRFIDHACHEIIPEFPQRSPPAR